MPCSTIWACWAEGFSTAMDRMPTKALDGRTIYEMLHDVKPDVAGLCLFGAPGAIVGLSKKLKRRAWTVVGLQASAGCMRYLGNVHTGRNRICAWRSEISDVLLGRAGKCSATL